MAPAALTATLVPIDSIRPDPKNAREHNERNLNSIVASLKKFGQRKPIVVDSDNVIRAGNGTWLAAKRLEWSHINVIVADLSPELMRQYAIADNRLGELSYFDEGVLAEQLAGIEDIHLIAIGFDQAELADIFDAQRDPVDESNAKSVKGFNSSAQVSVRMLIAVSNVEFIERAIQLTGEGNRELAILTICKAYCELKTKDFS